MNRETFVTLNKTRLFTADQVVDIVKSERDTCPQNKIWQHCPAVEQIMKGAREKVLDEVIKWIEREGFYRGMNATYNYIRQLRQAGSHCDKCDHWDICEGCPYTDERQQAGEP
jgi:hypothetical protein